MRSKLLARLAVGAALTVLAAIALWAGLHAWTFVTPEPRLRPPPELPPAPELALERFEPIDTSVADPVVAQPGPRGALTVRTRGTADEDLEIVLLDGRTRAPLARRRIAAGTAPGDLRFADVPEGEHEVAVVPAGGSPRFAYRVAERVTTGGAATVSLQAFAVPLRVVTEDGGADWVPVTPKLRRADDPLWYPMPVEADAGEPAGSLPVAPGRPGVTTLPPLGPGRYVLEFERFEPTSPAGPVEFEVPRSEPLVVHGRVLPGIGTAPTEASGSRRGGR